MKSYPSLFMPLVGAQPGPFTNVVKANLGEEPLIARGGRWWMRQARLYAEQLAAEEEQKHMAGVGESLSD